MKRFLCFYLMFALLTKVQAQNVTITPNGVTPSAGGLTIPRISYTAILDLPSPQSGDMAYDTTFECLRIYSRGKWLCSYEVPGAPTSPENYHPNMSAIATAGGTEADFPANMAIDNAGNIYVIGSYKGTSTFGANTISSNGDYDIFVAKYDKNGILKWVKSGGGTGEDFGYGICVDGSGNVYITGKYKLTATFGALTTTTAAASSMFIVKYDNNGNEQWVKSTTPGGTITLSQIFPQDIAIDSNGDLYITGGFYGTVNFGSFTRSTAPGSSNAFITKCDSSGEFQWVQTLVSLFQQTGYNIAVDSNNNVYVTGTFADNIVFGSISKRSYQSTNDIFLAKYNSNGVAQWVQSAGGSGYDTGTAVYVDDDNQVYVAGHYEGTATFGTSSKTAVDGSDIFLAKYDVDGSLLWVQSAGGSSHDRALGIAVDGNKNVYLTGYFSGSSVAFGSITKASYGPIDGFVAKYNSSGTINWVEIFGGTGHDMFSGGIGCYGNGIIFLTGSYSGTANFGTNTLTSQGVTDIFIAIIQN
ncbi:SBBP repeat-containing protein [Emticicia sp. 17c]|uniref:SBBP repeat-containing protein n=1 Tax=Emticicia sp. 17c TaxID=3127704 RepID=UPI00301DC9C8